MKIGCWEVPKPSYPPLLWLAEWKAPAPFRKLRYSWNCLNGLIYLSHGMIERTLCQLLPGPSLAANPVELLRVLTSFTLFNDLDGGRLDLRLSDFRFSQDIVTWGPGASLRSDFTCKKISSLEYNGSRYYTKSWFWFSARLSNPFCQVRDPFCRDLPCVRPWWRDAGT